MKCIVSLILIFFSAPAFAQDWKWAGFEVIGNHSVTRAEILSYIPIKVGDTYKDDLTLWQEWCTNLKVQFKFHNTQCSAVRYLSFQAYFVVEIVETGYEYRNHFRPAPVGDTALASPEILELYESLYRRLWELFNQGQGVYEITVGGYLDFSDAEMHEIVEKLIRLVPKYRETLLEVLEKDKDIGKREKAANLLNWTITDLQNTVVKSTQFLDDPSALVRNNISRFTSHFVDTVGIQSDRQILIDRFLLQLDRPSHGDRNKAIYNLLTIGKTFVVDRPYINTKGLPLIEYIGKTSVLDNVRDPAEELAKIIR